MRLLHFVLIAAVAMRTCSGQSTHPVNCTRIYRTVQRNGAFLLGQLTIPMSNLTSRATQEQGFKLELSLNKAVRSVHVRQAKAREMGNSHKKFMIDTTPKDGTMRLDTAIRLRSGFRTQPARVVRVLYNGLVLCGPGLTQSEEDESVTVNARVHITTPAAATTKVPDDSEDDFDLL